MKELSELSQTQMLAGVFLAGFLSYWILKGIYVFLAFAAKDFLKVYYAEKLVNTCFWVDKQDYNSTNVVSMAKEIKSLKARVYNLENKDKVDGKN